MKKIIVQLAVKRLRFGSKIDARILKFKLTINTLTDY